MSTATAISEVSSQTIERIHRQLSRHPAGTCVSVTYEAETLGISRTQANRAAMALRQQGRFLWMTRRGYRPPPTISLTISRTEDNLAGPRPTARLAPSADAGKVLDIWHFTEYSSDTLTEVESNIWHPSDLQRGKPPREGMRA